MEIIEIWQDIIGFEGIYQVSNLGNIKSLERTQTNSIGVAYKYPSILMKKERMKLGYLRVQLSNGVYKIKRLIHVLVAERFVDGHFEGAEVNHEDGDKSNNNHWNLKWTTKSKNIIHSYEVIGRKKPEFKTVPVNMFSLDGILVKSFNSVRDAAEYSKSSGGNITEACKGKYKTIKGYRWSYA